MIRRAGAFQVSAVSWFLSASRSLIKQPQGTA